AAEDLEARSCESVAALGRLVGVGCGADRHRFALPTATGDLGPEHFRDVGLHAQRSAVAVVGRAVGAALEGAHVAEGTAVGAAHIGIEGPLEGHPFDPIERRLTWLLAELHNMM